MIKSINHFFYYLAKKGPLFFFIYFKESLIFDLIRSTNTSLRVIKTNQSFTSDNLDTKDGLLYVASFTSVIRNTLSISENYLRTRNYNNFQFIDLGCGKGKALLVFAEMFNSINKIIGIEYDPNLCKIATNNIKISKMRNNYIKVVCDSAVNLIRYVDSDIIVFYFYNSFQGKTLDLVLDYIKNMKHVIIYVDPVEVDKLINRGYRSISSKKGKYNANTWNILTLNIDR